MLFLSDLGQGNVFEIEHFLLKMSEKLVKSYRFDL